LNDKTWGDYSLPYEYNLANYLNTDVPHINQESKILEDNNDISKRLSETFIIHFYACINYIAKRASNIQKILHRKSNNYHHNIINTSNTCSSSNNSNDILLNTNNSNGCDDSDSTIEHDSNHSSEGHAYFRDFSFRSSSSVQQQQQQHVESDHDNSNVSEFFHLFSK